MARFRRYTVCGAELLSVSNNGIDVYDWEKEDWTPKPKTLYCTDIGIRNDGFITLRDCEISFYSVSGAPMRKLYNLPKTASFAWYYGIYRAFDAGDNKTLFACHNDSMAYLVSDLDLYPQLIPNLSISEGAAVSVLGDGRVMITGGTRRSPLAKAMIVDLDTLEVTQAQRMQKQRSGHKQTTLGTGEVLVSGGCVRWEAELYCPVTNTWVPVGAPPSKRRGKKSRDHNSYHWISDERGLVGITPLPERRVYPVELGQWWTPASHVKLQINIRRRATYLFVCLMRAGLHGYALMIIGAVWRTELVEKKK